MAGAPVPSLPSPLLLHVALSGGRDSVALLAALAEVAPERGWRLQAVHVHHGLSPRAGAWADFCSGLCARLEVPLVLHRVQVAAAGEGPEAAARRARYRVFAGLQGDALVLGHHREDQAETALFNLLRGAGPRGLAAMPAHRLLARPDRSPLPLLRPLLEEPRQELEDWLQSRGLAWVEDESNGDCRLSRNFLRHEVLPRLEQRFAASAGLARAARLAGEAEAVLAEVAAADLAAAGAGSAGGLLRAADLARLSPARGRNLLRHWLDRQGLPMPEAAALEELWRQACAARPDARTAWRLGGWTVRIWRGALFLDRDGAAALLPADRPWQGEVPVPWGAGRILSRPGAGLAARFFDGSVPVVFAPRRGGERLALPGRPRKSLKQLLQEAAVPPWRRESLPLLWIGGEVAWVPGLGVAAAFVCEPGEPGWALQWMPAEGDRGFPEDCPERQ